MFLLMSAKDRSLDFSARTVPENPRSFECSAGFLSRAMARRALGPSHHSERRGDQGNDRLHVAKIFALRRTDGERKSYFRRKTLWVERTRFGKATGRNDRDHAFGALHQSARRVAFRRVARAPCHSELDHPPA